MKTVLSYLAVLITTLLLMGMLNTNKTFISKTYGKDVRAFKDSTKKIDNGIGPIKKLKLGPTDKKLSEKGRDYFDSKCIACHNLDKNNWSSFKEYSKR